MKTTIDIPDSDLKEVLRHTKAKTKREAILKALNYYNKAQRYRSICDMLGTFEDFMTQKDLKEIREDES